MPRWKFADGTVVELGGKVTGRTRFAYFLRRGIEDRVTVNLVVPYGVPLDPGNVFLLHAYLTSQQYGKQGVSLVESDYQPQLSDAPAEVQEALAAMAADEPEPGTIY